VSTKGRADVVFCVDDSGSMSTCFEAVNDHLADFVNGLSSGNQQVWDLRLDYVVYSTPEGRYRSMYNRDLWDALYGSRQGRFFSSEPVELGEALRKERAEGGDEASLIGLDFALDLPWRDAASCHRAVIQLTDEPFEGGVSALHADPEADTYRLIDKLQALGVMLFLVAPRSPIYELLSEADRSEYIEADIHKPGLAGVDFGKVLDYIGKSISVSMLQRGAASNPGPLFGQPSWR
jgi:hypothetical protein